MTNHPAMGFRFKPFGVTLSEPNLSQVEIDEEVLAWTLTPFADFVSLFPAPPNKCNGAATYCSK
jgi:hypothetical protein